MVLLCPHCLFQQLPIVAASSIKYKIHNYKLLTIDRANVIITNGYVGIMYTKQTPTETNMF